MVKTVSGGWAEFWYLEVCVTLSLLNSLGSTHHWRVSRLRKLSSGLWLVSLSLSKVKTTLSWQAKLEVVWASGSRLGDMTASSVDTYMYTADSLSCVVKPFNLK